MRSWSNRLAVPALWLGMGLLFPDVGLSQVSLPPSGAGPSEVVKVRYPDYNPDGSLKSVMLGDKALIDGDTVTFSNLRVEMYEEGKLVTSFWAETCQYNKVTGVLKSDSPVRVVRTGLVLTGDGMDWKKGETQVVIRRNVRLVSLRNGGWFTQEKRP